MWKQNLTKNWWKGRNFPPILPYLKFQPQHVVQLIPPRFRRGVHNVFPHLLLPFPLGLRAELNEDGKVFVEFDAFLWAVRPARRGSRETLPTHRVAPVLLLRFFHFEFLHRSRGQTEEAIVGFHFIVGLEAAVVSGNRHRDAAITIWRQKTSDQELLDRTDWNGKMKWIIITKSSSKWINRMQSPYRRGDRENNQANQSINLLVFAHCTGIQQ